jgi:hexosaminidase
LFSTGGDEVNTYCYDQDAQTQAELKESGKTLEQGLSDFVHALDSIGKTAVVWEGKLSLFCLFPVESGSVVQQWSWIII